MQTFRMAELLPDIPLAYHGLWERTLLERYSAGTLTSERPARVYWMQTRLWHADLRIPTERPDFTGVARIEDCDAAQLRFLAGQEAFFGVTRVEGVVCTWLRYFDLRPGVALDIGRMTFETPDLLIERGIGEDYLEHWSRVPRSTPEPSAPPLTRGTDGTLFLTCGNWGMRVGPRPPAPAGSDPYAPLDGLNRADLVWRAALEVTLCEHREQTWTAVLSTHPWVEGRTIDFPSEAAQRAGKAVTA